MKKTLIALALFATFAAQAMTAAELLDDMSSKSNAKNMQALSYLDGVLDGALASRLMAVDKTNMICLPSRITLGQLSDEVHARLLTANRRELGNDAFTVVYGYLMATYPCITKRKTGASFQAPLL